ncbi:hypothetical protein H4219_003417 [Mycoemilia scoparia]|uniref:Uncharacterized protein n=1 Tax=Mycoemilia scoparia TaxID=417184 RepID=A0A9W7ZUU5_9FUNG|nr:hypothetical protein H4219_003417 [Mycoemilia scoparia]
MFFHCLDSTLSASKISYGNNQLDSNCSGNKGYADGPIPAAPLPPSTESANFSHHSFKNSSMSPRLDPPSRKTSSDSSTSSTDTMIGYSDGGGDIATLFRLLGADVTAWKLLVRSSSALSTDNTTNGLPPSCRRLSNILWRMGNCSKGDGVGNIKDRLNGLQSNKSSLAQPSGSLIVPKTEKPESANDDGTKPCKAAPAVNPRIDFKVPSLSDIEKVMF